MVQNDKQVPCRSRTVARGEKAVEGGGEGGLARGSEEMGMKVGWGRTAEKMASADSRIQKRSNKLLGMNVIFEMIPSAPHHCPHVGIHSSWG